MLNCVFKVIYLCRKEFKNCCVEKRNNLGDSCYVRLKDSKRDPPVLLMNGMACMLSLIFALKKALNFGQ